MSDQPNLEPVRRAALLATLHDLSQPPAFLAGAISTAARQTTANLRIILFSPSFNEATPTSDAPRGGIDLRSDRNEYSHAGHWHEVQRLLTFVYVQATKVAQDMGKVLMDIDVLLRGTEEQFPEELIRDVERTYCVTPPHPRFPALPASVQERTDVVSLKHDASPHFPHHPHPPPPSDPNLPSLFPVVALGGTFDHLHAGHKILLSMAAWIASEKLIVGITDDVLLKNKVNKEVLEKLPVRTARTRAFLELFKAGLEYDIVPINDVYGPTAWDPNVQALVVSKETLPGAAAIHKLRAEKSLPSLETFVIDVISSTEASVDDEDAEVLKNTKLSSTFIRQWIVEHPDAR
ncbi:Nucleotidylyl transferase [Laetiporus sulphureus 93-53]|uniref:Nucleotidylyl transferase n=1 Tax=Laetiporus sulphureus 93-53 TaxID=1314785 RepID=A0A165FZT3_9APHY|nr:Nucleotidylyl transferase [Laetiporus sulphureus 93-53]KZT09636.1 Nucleotidylyl transferase [Laetiporus sulphureus 93-53]